MGFLLLAARDWQNPRPRPGALVLALAPVGRPKRAWIHSLSWVAQRLLGMEVLVQVMGLGPSLQKD